jgi:integrase
MKLTTAIIKAEPPPRKGATTLWDEAITGFGIRIYAATDRNPDGARAWFLNYRIDGAERRYTIGPYPLWRLDAARAEAKELRKRIDRGEDPTATKRERRAAPTIQDLVDRYVLDHLPKKSDDKGRVADEKRMLEEIAKRLGKHTKVTDIHGGDIADMHRKITESGRPVRANRILAVCSKMFALSLVPRAGENMPWRNAVLGNPCKGVERNREEARERFFSQSELTAISDALNEYPGVAADCVRLIMLTGCRPSEAIQARWDEFDGTYWNKPSAHTKRRRPHKLPLNPAAIELIGRLRRGREGEWVFPGDKPGQHLAALWHVWHFVRDRAGLGDDARVYDLRHTFASVGAGGGLSLPIIGRLLGHTQQRTTQRYAHFADDPLKEATAKIGNVIAPTRDGEVVNLKG